MAHHPASPGPDRSEGDVNSSPSRLDWQRARLSEATLELLRRDADVFLHQCLSTPCLNALRACEGIYLEDVQGRRIMDFHGNYVHQVGYRNPRVLAAVKAQLDVLPFCPRRYTNEPAVELAAKLAALAPEPLGKVLLAPSGAVAVGMALQLARVATGRFKTVSMWDAFHGATLDAVSVGGEALFRAGIGPLVPGAVHVPPPGARTCVFGCGGDCTLRCADYLEYVLEHERDVAAVIAEPIRASNVSIPHRDYWHRVRAACDRHGALLIFDEIPTGLGRTGALFALEHTGVRPDILVLGKGLGGGVMPLAAIVARRDLDVAAHKALGHYTHEKSPLAAAAGLATLECLMADGLPARARRLGALAQERLNRIRGKSPCVGEVRGRGLLIGVEVVNPRDPKQAAPDRAEQVMYAALSRGLSFKIGGGSTIVLVPPLTITEQELDAAMDILDECFALAMSATPAGTRPVSSEAS